MLDGQTGWKGNKPLWDCPERAIINGHSNRAFSRPCYVLNKKGGKMVRAIIVFQEGKDPYWGFVTSPGTQIRRATYSEVKYCKKWENAQTR